ncbi:hypothetical protein ACH3PA_07225 [Leeuwenhoekiella sp. A2]|uniref:hypothetical protein n=1 Tax=Leeuwenhoekiella sp. A2 TaxID=3141460 RepID=UPI003A8039B2
MKKINLSDYNGKSINYFADDLLLVGIYITTSPEFLKMNFKALKTLSLHNNKNLYRLNDGAIISANDKLRNRIDFLITGNTYFECVEMIGNYAFDGQFYKEFCAAFEMLDTQIYEDYGSK